MGTELVWPSLCLAIAVVLLLAELFVPSAGLVGVLAFGFLCISLYLAFATTPYGWVFVVIAGLILPAALVLWAHYWPKTPFAKYWFLKPPEQDEIRPEGHGSMLDHLVGQFVRTLTPLRPSGTVELDGRRFEAQSEEGMISANVIVRVVRVRGGRLQVRVAEIPDINPIST